MTNKKITILYERLSKDDDTEQESNSISNQKQLLEEYAERNGFTPYIHLNDDGYSGTGWDRPGWQKAIKEIHAGNVENLIFKDLSRFGRDHLRVGLYMELFKEKGVRMITVNDGIDTSNDKGHRRGRTGVIVSGCPYRGSHYTIGAKLLIIDPVQAYFGGRNMNNAGGVRPLMKQLGAVAARHGCAILLVGHLHIINSTNIDCMSKFRNFKGSAFAIRRIADFLCVQNGLSIIADPKPSRGSYGKWQGETKPQTNREKLEHMIDVAMEKSKDFDSFLATMKELGCEVKHNKNLAFKIPGTDRFARCSSLGEDYTEEAIIERLRGLRKVTRKQPADVPFEPFMITRRTSFTLLIDIEKKIREGKGAAYEQWAGVYNLKQMAKTLVFLKDNNIDSYDELVQKSSAATSNFLKKSTRLNEIEARQKEISELQKQIGTYGKTREVYKKYLASGRDQSFHDVHAADIILHEAAKKHFNKLGYGKERSC